VWTWPFGIGVGELVIKSQYHEGDRPRRAAFAFARDDEVIE
jgi:hypothetical protein